MKKMLTIVFAMALCSAFANDSTVVAPYQKVYRTGYLRLGIALPGQSPESNCSVLQNFRNGCIGNGLGYRLEFGRLFYFFSRNKQRFVNAGIDWTVLSLGYAPLSGWEGYSPKSGTISIENPSLIASASTRLGPVIAINPIAKLVIEAKAQLTYNATATAFYLDEYKTNSNSVYQYFTTVKSEEEANSVIGYGFGSSFGLTARYGMVGFSAEYSKANLPMWYKTKEAGGSKIEGNEKFPFKSFELKLNLSF